MHMEGGVNYDPALSRFDAILNLPGRKSPAVQAAADRHRLRDNLRDIDRKDNGRSDDYRQRFGCDRRVQIACSGVQVKITCLHPAA